MKWELTVASEVQSYTCGIVVNIHLEALAVGIPRDLPFEQLNQLRNNQNRHWVSRLVDGPFGYDG